MNEDPTKRVCDACDELSPVSAAFCWKCYAPFGAPVAAALAPDVSPQPSSAYAGPAAGRPGFSPVPAHRPPPPAPAPATRTLGGMQLVIGMAVALVASVLAYRVLAGGGIELPDSVNGIPRMDNQTSKLIEAQLAELDTGGAEVAVYGAGTIEYLIFAMEGRATEDADQMMQAFLAGAVQQGASASPGDIEISTHADADLRCVPITGAAAEGAACLWRSDSSSGAVFAIGDDVAQTQTLTASIYDDLS